MRKLLLSVAAAGIGVFGLTGAALADSGGPTTTYDCNLNGLENMAAHAGAAKALKVLTNRHTNAGPGNGGEFAGFFPLAGEPLCGNVATEDNDAFPNLTDPGNSGGNNNAPSELPN